MPSTDPPSGFVLYGTRESIAAGAVHLERYAGTLERAIDERNCGLALDIAKALVESVCKTILQDRGHPCDENWNVPKLLKETCSRVQLVPDGLADAKQVADSLRSTMGGLQTTIQGLAELRNAHGFASHGKPPLAVEIEVVQAILRGAAP